MGFKPGQSGNPSGRPKVVKDIQDLARKYTVDAVNCLMSIVNDDDADPRARVAAANAILDRGYGKPIQQVKQENTHAYVGEEVVLVRSAAVSPN